MTTTMENWGRRFQRTDSRNGVVKWTRLLGRSIALLCLLALGDFVAMPSRSWAASTCVTTRAREASFTVDGVEVDVCSSFLPSPTFVASTPTNAQQGASSVSWQPYRAFSVAVDPVTPISNSTISPQQVDSQGPTIIMFGERVVGRVSEANLDVDGTGINTIIMAEWTVDAGNRRWTVRMSEEQTLGISPAAFVDSLGEAQLSSTTLANPSTRGTGAASRGGTGDQPPAPLHAQIRAADDLPAPSWWNSAQCDSNHNPGSYALGASYRGVVACGPLGGNVPEPFYQGAIANLEWQCVEYVERFMYLAYGTDPYRANGNQIYDNYPGTSGAKLIRIPNGTPNQAPQPGDVLSDGATDPRGGHTAVVSASSVDSNGNGTIQVVEQNADPSGTESLNVRGWYVQYSKPVIGWLHNPGSSSSSTFVRTPDQKIYRIAGGAPLYIADCSPLGGCSPLQDVSNLGAYAAVPADGTFLQAAESGHIYRVAGGAPLYIGDCGQLSGCSGYVTVNQYTIDNLDHLRRVPSDATFVRAVESGDIYRIAGGAPLLLSSCQPQGIDGCPGAVNVNAATIASLAPIDPGAVGAGFALNSRPTDGTLLRATDHNDATYKIVGGVAAYLTSCDGFNGCAAAVDITESTIDTRDHLNNPYLIKIDAPSNTSPSTPDANGTIPVSGWAIDATSTGGSGVDEVDLYLDGQAGQGGVMVGSTTVHGPRTDVGNVYGSQFNNCGYSIQANMNGVAPGTHILYVYSTRGGSPLTYSTQQFVLNPPSATSTPLPATATPTAVPATNTATPSTTVVPATNTAIPSATATGTPIMATATVASPTGTASPSVTATPIPPTSIATATPSNTASPMPSTATLIPATSTSVPAAMATQTTVPTATATNSAVLTATATPVSPTATATLVPPSATNTPVPTASFIPSATPIPPTATATPVPPTATNTPTLPAVATATPTSPASTATSAPATAASVPIPASSPTTGPAPVSPATATSAGGPAPTSTSTPMATMAPAATATSPGGNSQPTSPTDTPAPPSPGRGTPQPMRATPTPMATSHPSIAVTALMLPSARVLSVSVRTVANAHVTVTLQVFGRRTVLVGKGKHRGRMVRVVVLYAATMRGTTGRQGRLTGRLPITYRPARPVQAFLSVTVRGKDSSATARMSVLLKPHR